MTTTAPPVFALTVSPGTAVHGVLPGHAYHLVVTDTGQLPVAVRGETVAVGAGCSLHSSSGLTISPSSFHLRHGQSQPVTVTSDIPAGQHADLAAVFTGTAKGSGNAHVSAGVGTRFETGTSAVSCGTHHNPAPVAAGPAGSGGFPTAGLGAGLGVLIVAAVVVTVQRRRRSERQQRPDF